MLLGMGLIPVSTGGYYIVTTFATSYGTEPAFGIGISEHLMLNILSVAALGELVSTLFIGVMADRIGRKKTMVAALVLTSVLVMPMFLSMSPENPLLMFVLFTAFRIAMNGTWAPLASIMSQMFDAESRQSALSVSYGLGNAIWAGLSPVVATALFAATGTIWSVILLYMGMATLSMVCLVLAPRSATTSSTSTTRPRPLRPSRAETRKDTACARSTPWTLPPPTTAPPWSPPLLSTLSTLRSPTRGRPRCCWPAIASWQWVLNSTAARSMRARGCPPPESWISARAR
ncbi:MFS transporter [Micrococcus luteus]|nr:MFS transporter [Micrococcus luteus]